MSFWAAAQLVPNRTALALHFLTLNGFETYNPRTRSERVHRGRRVAVLHQLFPGYCFVNIELQWHAARWCPGIVRLVTTDGERPTIVPDSIIHALRKREKNGVIEIPKNGFAIGEQVKIVSGAFAGRAAIYQGQAAHERVSVLLAVLGKLELRKDSIRPVK